MKLRSVGLVGTIIAALALFAAAPARGQGTEIRLPGLRWGSSIAEVTAALVARDFDFVGRDSNGSLMFEGADLLGHEAGVVARMYRGRLVKVIAFLEPREAPMGEQYDVLVGTLSRFFGDPSESAISGETDVESERSDVLQCGIHKLTCWLAGSGDEIHGLFLRTTDRPGFRLDFESPVWLDAMARMGRSADEISVDSGITGV